MRTKERLLLGDSTKRLAEIEDASVDLILTDPPYNTGMTAKSGTRLTHFFDDRYSPEEYRTLARTTARECYRILKNDRGCYVFVNWRSLGVWLDALATAGFRLKNVIVWDKIIHGLNHQNYAHTHEFLIFAAKGRFFPRNQGTADDQSRDLWHLRRETRQARADEFHHETAKPISLVRRPIELDPRFFSLAAARIANVTQGHHPLVASDDCLASRRKKPASRVRRARRVRRSTRRD